ncbi:uncharacterized protein LOC115455838 [Manduca sexta]|uniref:uncharacterized protein LOC115455838 n=1 Tax=Manduca sexta TaxID=7130 RepID=UPI0018907AF5|nr:uncharacterized protein LOC115455838 [Manduca sexta]
MNATGQLNQQLQQDLQNELITANQLLRLISFELQQLKSFTCAGGEFEANIKENALLLAKLASMKNINIENLPLMTRIQTNIAVNDSHLPEQSLRNETSMED